MLVQNTAFSGAIVPQKKEIEYEQADSTAAVGPSKNTKFEEDDIWGDDLDDEFLAGVLDGSVKKTSVEGTAQDGNVLKSVQSSKGTKKQSNFFESDEDSLPEETSTTIKKSLLKRKTSPSDAVMNRKKKLRHLL